GSTLDLQRLAGLLVVVLAPVELDHQLDLAGLALGEHLELEQPAGLELEHVLAGAELEVAVLDPGGQRLQILDDRAAVLHRFVAEVVVGGHEAPRTLLATLPPLGQRDRPVWRPRSARPAFLHTIDTRANASAAEPVESPRCRRTDATEKIPSSRPRRRGSRATCSPSGRGCSCASSRIPIGSSPVCSCPKAPRRTPARRCSARSSRSRGPCPSSSSRSTTTTTTMTTTIRISAATSAGSRSAPRCCSASTAA